MAGMRPTFLTNGLAPLTYVLRFIIAFIRRDLQTGGPAPFSCSIYERVAAELQRKKG